MSDSGGDWSSPGGGDWQAPSYPPSYPQTPTPSAPAPQQQWGQQPGWAPAWTPMPGVVPLRPLGLGELLDGAVKVIRRYPKPTLAISAVVSIVTTLVTVVFLLASNASETLDPSSDSFSAGFSSDLGGVGDIPGTILKYVGGAILTGALVTVVSRAVLGQSVTLREAWDVTRPRFWALIGVTLMRAIIMLAPIALMALLAFAVGGAAFVLLLAILPYEVWAWTVLSLAPAALILEKVGVMAALKRSRALAHRGFWRLLGILLLGWLITFVLTSILVVPIVLIAELPLFTGDTATLGTSFFVVTAVLSGVVETVVSPYNAGLRALLYIDARMRTEGLDVALQTAAATPSAP